MKQTTALLIAVVVLVALGAKVIHEFRPDPNAEPTQEYVNYVQSYQDDLRRKLSDMQSEFTSDLSLTFDPAGMGGGSACRTSNFEGAEVTLEGIRFFDQQYGKARQPGYTYDCNAAQLDPDHPYFGLPDVKIDISPVEYFKPSQGALANFMKWMGAKEETGPFRTYEKQLLHTDSLGNTTLKKFAMELWLTRFNVTLTIRADHDKPNLNLSDQELSRKRYPRYWYGSTEPGRISVNDLGAKKEEYQEWLYSNLTFALKLNPNASPWYIKTGENETLRPKIAIAGLFCQHFEKKSLEEGRVDFNAFAGKASPLYYTPFEQTDTAQWVGGIESRTAQVLSQLRTLSEQNIWDRPYYARLITQNFGSRKQNLGLKKQDDQINLEFLMPLFVVGSLDVVLPSELLAEWNPPEAYSRSFGLKNLLPGWGMGLGGKIISAVILVVILMVALNTVFPFLRFLR
ncbi:hypothetical protein [Marinoscillum furvescens]|uniref:Uncharacterized protein n=1 Tax=Marinoscillum furvescens DSM 4134 TaxID=1122208 RepID=A0A3D9L8B1_MARFU|nr:hypothetical protein [Marinoscillum furvescens]REE01526.1 hypothetical protein C7460_10342 [Marinoscillum furvescens DSM 4134]